MRRPDPPVRLRLQPRSFVSQTVLGGAWRFAWKSMSKSVANSVSNSASSDQALDEALSQNTQFFPDREADFAAEHVVLALGNLLQQPAVGGYQYPERGLAVFGDVRNQFFP